MAIPKFDEKELTVVGVRKDRLGSETKIYNYPVSQREAVLGFFRREPYWQLTGFYNNLFSPKVNPDNIARGMIMESVPMDMKYYGGPDMFGIEWEYIVQVGGSMVRPGKPFVDDANDIADKIVWPDPDKWDWQRSVDENTSYFDPNVCNVMWLLNGWYERLISFMDFENAIMALYDEDQKDAVHAFFDQLTDLYIKIFDKFITYFPQLDGFCIHDDWGSQKETFFSPELAEEMIVPYMRRMTDYLHSKGKFCELHSCGNNGKQVPNYIKAGWDLWQCQAMNDTQALYEKYGDQILLGVIPDKFDTSAPEEVHRQAARDFIDRFMQPGKPCLLNFNDRSMWTDPFMEELYSYSRKKACGMV